MTLGDNEPRRVLAVDGGGTKTIAWIANAVPCDEPCNFDLEILGRGHAGPSNPRSVGFEAALANLDSAIAMAISQFPKGICPIEVACLSLAGAGRLEEQAKVKAWADNRQLANQTVVIDDVEPLRLAAMYEQSQSHVSEASSWEQSITLVVGTGSIAMGRNGNKRSARVGGWGYLLGDEGSGFALGLAGLQSLCQAHDGGEEMTAFHRMLLDQSGFSQPTELVGFVYQTPIPRAQIAGLSEVIFACSESDPLARKIIDDAVEAIVRLATKAARRLGLAQSSYSLALSGGILCSHPEIISQLLFELGRQELAPLTSHLVREPIHGPLLMAAQSLSNAS